MYCASFRDTHNGPTSLLNIFHPLVYKLNIIQTTKEEIIKSRSIRSVSLHQFKMEVIRALVGTSRLVFVRCKAGFHTFNSFCELVACVTIVSSTKQTCKISNGLA
jgi:hypothetical protein